MSGMIGSKIRALRTARKLTQKDLSLLSGISQQHISLMEKGRGGIELATLRKLLDALGHELAFVPRPSAMAAGLAARTRRWAKVSAWEAARRPPAGAGLEQAGALADFFLSRHRIPQTQAELRANAERVRALRADLARIKAP